MCAYWSFCTKFNSEQLLFKQFFDIIGNFGSVELSSESTFLFQYIIIFQRWQSFEHPRIYCPVYLLLPKSNFALFLSFSDLVLVGGILPSVLQIPPPFQLLADPRTFSSTFVEVVLITSLIIIHAVICRRSSSDLTKAMSTLSQHATAAYVILGIITLL